MSILYKLADNKNSLSIASKYRKKRHYFFMDLIGRLNIKTIVDIGGTQSYWKSYINDIKELDITIINLFKEKHPLANITSVVGNATNLEGFLDQQFDLVFSNSVIEHLFTKENQIRMANEVQRVGKSYFIQTPNKYFPLEPHFLFPFYQFLPNSLKLFLLRNFKLGHIGKINDKIKAQEQINEIQLLSKKEFKSMFPDAQIYEEKVFFMTKSFVAYKTCE